MKPFKLGFALLFAAGGILCTCSQDPGNNPTPCSSGSIMDAGETKMDASEASCLNVYIWLNGDACDDCLHQECCPALAACAATDYCLLCVFEGTSSPICDAPRPQIRALLDCVDTRCRIKECGFPSTSSTTSGSGGAGGSTSSTTSGGGSGG